MKKKEYEVPLTRYMEVEMEGGFMLASVGENPEDSKGSITIGEQEEGVAIGTTDDNGKWDTSFGDGWDI